MSKSNTVAKSALMIAIFTLISKFLGFLREMLIAYRYGSGYTTDTYFVALTATVIIMNTLCSALNTTLVPIFTEIDSKYGRRGKNKFLNNVLNVVLLATLVLVVLGYIFSPYVIKVLAKGFQGEQLQLAIELNRIGLPIIVFLGITYVFSGYLHSGEIFGPPAVMGLPYNFVYIIFLLFIANENNIKGLMIASIIAAATQFLIQYPTVKYHGYKFKPTINLKDKYLRNALSLIVPVVIGSAVQQINTVIDKTLASDLVEGSISALTYASRINDMIITVFVMAITTVVFPMLSRAFADKDDSKVKTILGEGINIILIITVPSMIGIIILAEPLVKIFFERGAFDNAATLMTSGALLFYSLGLVGSSLRLMLNNVFYSFQDTKTPMVNGAIAVGLNIILNIILIKPMKHEGLALATSISITVTTLFLFINLRKKLGPIGLKNYLICLIKTFVASLIMGLVVYMMFNKLQVLLPSGNIYQLLLLVASVAVGVVIYFVLCILFRVKEVRGLIERFIKR